jgi:hypothetical protein
LSENREQEIAAMAYLALGLLRDENPGVEPEHFRRTRLDLHRRLDPEAAQDPSLGAAVGRLRLVP